MRVVDEQRAAGLGAVTAALLLLVVLWPSDAFAWGPLAHLSFSGQALAGLAGLGEATRGLLARFAAEFLYGSLAADIVVGKNLARYAVHCHNWRVGFRVLDAASADRQRAFALGFLAHLAADTIAHNYFVPYKLVESHNRRGAGHAYWELRYDQAMPGDTWRLARRVCRAEYREHDELLAGVLADSQVLPFSLSRRLFSSMLLAAQLRRWQRFSTVLAAKRALVLHEEEWRESRKLAVSSIVDVLRSLDQARCTLADPTGARNLQLAVELRRRLSRRPSPIARGELGGLLGETRAAFRESMYGRVQLPSVHPVI